jgi:hypothetical protein
MTTKEIEDIVIENLIARSFPIYLTSFEGQGFSEIDVMGISGSGVIYEFEIKRSRADFFADIKNKKYKHTRMVEGDAIWIYDEWKKGKRTGNKVKQMSLPNRFYYVCEEGMILPEEVPQYAGLLYVIPPKEIQEIKPSKILHKNKADIAIYKRIAIILSQRNVFGCSYATHKIKNSFKK